MIRQVLSLAILGLAISPAAKALTPISFTGTDYTQLFDTLPFTGANPTYTGAGPFDVPTSDSLTLAGWSFYKSGGSGTNALFRIDNGTLTSGSLYSYGATSSTERAIGALSSGTTATTFGATFSNDTATTLTSFTLTYTGEQWRRGSGAANTLTFSFSLGATNISSGVFTTYAALNFTAPVNTGINVALDGNLAANQVAISQTISGLSWAPGTTLTIRWADVDDVGSDDGLGVDNLTFAAAAATLRTLVWNTVGGTWDTTAPNWTGDATVFQTGDVVRFTDAAVGAVTVDAGGVSPSQINVENTTGTYAFSGGPITGAGVLTKTGAGLLTLSSSVSMGQGIHVEGGTVQTTANELLNDTDPLSVGAAGTMDIQSFTETVGAVTLNDGHITGTGGKLVVTGGITVLAGTGTSVIASGLQTGVSALNVTVADGTAPVDFLISGPLTGASRLVFAGAGTSELLGDNTAFTSGVSINSGKLVIDQPAALGTNTFFFNGGTFATTTPMTITQFVSVGGNVTIDGTNAIEMQDFSSFFGSATKVITVLGDVTISGAITGTSVINKAGAGTLTLTADDPYVTDTTVQAGTLKLSGAGSLSGTPSIRVDAGATFDLSALSSYSILSTQTLRGGGTVIAPTGGLLVDGFLAPGGTAAGFFTQTLTAQGAMTLGSASTFQFELGGADSASYDHLAIVGGLLTLDGTLQLTLINSFVPAGTDTFTIITGDTGITGAFANVVGGRVDVTGGSFLLTQNAGSVVLSDYAVPVPEPGMVGLLTASAFFFVFLKRRKIIGLLGAS
jgi:autotransporter-associated beta strand protein